MSEIQKPSAKHLIATIHGIRTRGEWQNRLETLVQAEIDKGVRPPLNERPVFLHRKYQYFSIPAFFFSHIRKQQAHNFRRELENWVENNPDVERIDIFSHSFGTDITAKAITEYRIKRDIPPISTLVLTASVLPTGFPWDNFIGKQLGRIVSECGTEDNIIFLNRLTIPGLGAAGLRGFENSETSQFIQRFFKVGHSGYFESDDTGDRDWFLKKYWLPIALGPNDVPIERRDDRTPLTPLQGIREVLLNNATLIKVLFGAAIFALLTLLAFQFAQYWRLSTARAHEAAATELAGNAKNPVREKPEAVKHAVEALRGLPDAESQKFLGKIALQFAPVVTALRQPIDLLVASPKGNRVAFSSGNLVGTTALGDQSATRKHLSMSAKAKDLKFSYNGEILVAVDGEKIGILDMTAEDNRSVFKSGAFDKVEIDSLGQFIALGDADGRLEMRRISDWRLEHSVSDVQLFVLLRDSTLAYVRRNGELFIKKLNGPAKLQKGSAVLVLEKSPDGTQFLTLRPMATANSNDLIQVWALGSDWGVSSEITSEKFLRDIEFSASGKFVLTARYADYDATISAFDVASRSELKNCNLHDLQEEIFEYASPPEPKWVLASPDETSAVIIAKSHHEKLRAFALYLRNGQCISLGASSSPPTQAVFMSGSKYALLKKEDGSAALFDMESGEEVGQRPGSWVTSVVAPPSINWLVFSQDNFVRAMPLSVEDAIKVLEKSR